MQQERIRILVDRSRDSAWSDMLLRIEPDDVYQVTDNRNYLKGSILKNYDILTVCGYSTLEYEDEEIQLIVEFVKLGGGLLLASNTGKYEKDVGAPVSDMHINKIARAFGAEFLPSDRCNSEIKVDDDLIRGYPRENLRVCEHPALADLDLCDMPIYSCGIISVPDDSRVFLKHNETDEPVGACIRHGKGRIVIINDTNFLNYSQRMCRAFINWLGDNRVSKIEGSESIPDEIQTEEYIKEEGNVKIYYNNFSKDRIDTCMKFARKINDDLIRMFTSDIKWEIELCPSFTHRYHFDAVPQRGSFVGDAMLAYSLGFLGFANVDSLNFMYYAGFSPPEMSKYFGIMAMKLLGFEKEAEKICDEINRQFMESDPTGKGVDITRTYGYRTSSYHPKWIWVLNALTEKYGRDILARLVKILPDGDPWDIVDDLMLRHLFKSTDVFIYYLSLALSDDLYSWFQEIGTTVHPLPLYPVESDEFKNGIRQYLSKMIRDKSACASDRSDAIQCLIDIYDKEKITLTIPDQVDKYERMVSVMRLSQFSDCRAEQGLINIAIDDSDRSLSAVAALNLVLHGEISMSDRLIETAMEQDYRFRIEAGHALRRIEHERAEELFRDENGAPILGMQVENNALLRLFPTVKGQKVGNVFSLLHRVHHFPDNTHVTGMYVEWVVTKAEYRRMGLSSWTLKEIMKHSAVQQCACTFLNTGTRNIAHSMYRKFGFVDVALNDPFSMELREEKAKIVDGLMIRSYMPGDEVKMAALANEFYSCLLDEDPEKARRRRPDACIRIAEKADKLMGYVEATGRDKGEAQLMDICLKDVDNRSDIALALLCALHNDLVSRGFKKITITWNPLASEGYLGNILNQFGYTSQSGGGVKMFKIINLPMLMEELSPLLLKRLKRSDYKDWRGKIGILSDQHRATIIIDDEISAAEELLSDVDMLISGSDDAITRIIAGRINPFEAYLQNELSIKPIVNDRVTGLLEKLFPRIPFL